MIDLPDELILLLLEKVNNDSLLRCRKTCRLLCRISLDRILLTKIGGIATSDGILLQEEVIHNRELFATVIEDGRWSLSLAKRIRIN
jgi:hypothetical protein